MSKADAIRNLYEYNEWANNTVLKAAFALNEDEFSRPQGASFDSVEGNLAHLLAAQVIWLQRWTGGANPIPLRQVQAIRGFESIREAFEKSHEGLRGFVSSLTEERLDEPLAYKDSRGGAHKRVLWQLMAHLVNHGTQHRQEVAVALTEMGIQVRDLDYGLYCDIRGSESAGTLEMIRALYEYNEWANRHVLAALAGLSDEELMRPRGVSHNSLGMDLLHLVGAQVGWLATWGGAPRIPLPSAASGRFLDSLLDWFERSHESLRQFVASLTDQDLGRALIDNADGSNKAVKPNRSMLLWDMTMHVVNHGTQHRSEAAMVLTSLGRSPGEIDYVFFETGRG